MSKELLYAESSGVRIVSDNFDIAIDPVSMKQGSFPDAIIFSSLKAAACYGKAATPMFASSNTRNLLMRASEKFESEELSGAEEIISCTPRKKSTIRVNKVPVAELTFLSHKEFPANSHILLKTKTRTILYTSDIKDRFKLPPHDTLIICANKKTPMKNILSRMEYSLVKIESFSDLSSVLQFFNEEFKDVTVGIDSSIMEKSYEYLKADCTVFSSSVKPLSSYSLMPQIIITADETQYTDRFCIFSSEFEKDMSLADIYEFSKSSSAKAKIVICPGLETVNKRGDITLCPEECIINLQDFECCGE